MKTKSLENSVRIMEYQSLEDEKQKQDLINELINPEQDFDINFIKPFRNELNKNLLNKESKDGIRIVIIHYTNEFLLPELFFEEHKMILYDNNFIGENSSEYSPPPLYEDGKLSDFEKYIITSYYIFNCHFYDIQECCNKNQINFFDLCRDLHFKWDLISTGITLIYKEPKDLIQFKNNIAEEVVDHNSQKRIKLFPEFLSHENKDILAKKIKNKFTIEKGKGIRLLIETLKNKNILSIEYRENMIFYEALSNYFNRYIGSYQSIFDYRYSKKDDAPEVEATSEKINIILENLNKEAKNSL